MISTGFNVNNVSICTVTYIISLCIRLERSALMAELDVENTLCLNLVWPDSVVYSVGPDNLVVVRVRMWKTLATVLCNPILYTRSYYNILHEWCTTILTAKLST